MSECKTDEDGVTYVEKKPEDYPFKTTMDYILNESDINDELISKAYAEILSKIDDEVFIRSGCKFLEGVSDHNHHIHEYSLRGLHLSNHPKIP